MNAEIAIRKHGAVVAATLAMMLAFAGAEATAQKNQGPPNALQGFSQNREEPVKIKASSLEVREKDKIATFNGDVHVIQGDTELRCKSLVVLYDEDTRGAKAADSAQGGQKQIRRIEAKGGVTVTQNGQNAFGDTASFDMRANLVTLTGNVVVTQGSDVLRGQRLVVDLGTGVTKMDQGRVEGLFMPRNTERK